jgi:hypothetical protein
MRNFFKNTFSKIPTVKTKQIAELLGTKEEKVIKQYRDCLKYITRVKNEVVQKSEDFIQARRQLTIR